MGESPSLDRNRVNALYRKNLRMTSQSFVEIVGMLIEVSVTTGIWEMLIVKNSVLQDNRVVNLDVAKLNFMSNPLTSDKDANIALVDN